MCLVTAAGKGPFSGNEPAGGPLLAGLLTTTPEGAEDDAVLTLFHDNDDDSNSPMIILPEFTSQTSSGLVPVVHRRSEREACISSTWQEIEVAPFADPVTGKQVIIGACG